LDAFRIRVWIHPFHAYCRITDTHVFSGKAPAVVAKGGFSGVFPDSSEDAYGFVQYASSPATILYCDVRLTKDEFGICLPDIKMDNCTDIADIYPQGQKTYLVNGVPTSGWFSVDYNLTELGQVPRKCYDTFLSYLIKYWMLFMPATRLVLDHEEKGNASSPLNEKRA